MPRSLIHVALLVLLLASACHTGRDYPDATGPRYAGGPPAASAETRVVPDTVRFVTFNVKFARDIDGAIALIAREPALRAADVFLLQEMDAPGTKRIAESLGMWYVYYPAIFHHRADRDFGNAVLSRWPIADDAKVVLPHPSQYAGTHRIATAATLRVGATRIRVYSTHLGTVADIGAGRRRDQLRAIVAHAADQALVVIGGDLNDGGVGVVAEAAGYTWPTRDGPRTTRFGRWDHLLLKGLASPDTMGAGTVDDARDVSDHRPVWAVGVLRHGHRDARRP